MRRYRAVLIGLLLLLVVAPASAQTPIPPYTFVQGPDNQIWLIVSGGRRLAVPVSRVSEVDLNATSWNGAWVVPEADGSGLTVAIIDNTGALAPSQPQAGPPPAPAGEIKIAGTGQQNTKPFDLAAGNYTVRWSGSQQAGPAGLGNLIITLKRADGQFMHETIVNTVLNRERPQASGETQVYGAKSGPHYLEVLAPGPWSVTFTPL